MLEPTLLLPTAGYDPMVAGARRYPRVIDQAEIDSLPRREFSPGNVGVIFLSRERDDAKYFRQGYCWVEADAVDYEWFPANFDEAQFCLEGLIRLHARDAAGRELVLEAGPGEHVYMPAGFQYRQVATGVRTAFFFSSGPSARRGMSDTEYSAALIATRTGVARV